MGVLKVIRKVAAFFRLVSRPDVSGEKGLEEQKSPVFSVYVESPRTVKCMRGIYTTYKIVIQTTSTAFRLKRSDTRRRFSEFVWLRKHLDNIDNWKSPPSLPPKRFWNLRDPEFVEERRYQLEQWIYAVLEEPVYMSSTAAHLFLQTELTVDQIDDYLEGGIAEERIQEIWDNNGKLYYYQPHNLLHNSVHQAPVEICFTEEDEILSKAPSPTSGLLLFDDPPEDASTLSDPPPDDCPSTQIVAEVHAQHVPEDMSQSGSGEAAAAQPERGAEGSSPEMGAAGGAAGGYRGNVVASSLDSGLGCGDDRGLLTAVVLAANPALPVHASDSSSDSTASPSPPPQQYSINADL